MSRRNRAAVLATVFAIAVPGFLPAADRLAFQKPLVSSDSKANTDAVAVLLDQAGSTISRLYGDSLKIVADGTPAEYTLSTVASLEKDSTVVSISLARNSDGSKTPSLAWLSPLTAETPLWLARAAFLLWNSFHGYQQDRAGAAPILVDEVPAIALDPYSVPLAVAVTRTGTLAVALGMRCVELDTSFRLVGSPGKTLGEKGNTSYAGSVAATPGGSLVLKPSLGRDIYKVQDEGIEPQRIPTAIELSTIYYWTALADGSVVLIDISLRKAYRVASGQKRQELPVFANPMSWPSAYAGAPDGSLWIFDPLMKGVRIFTAEGTPSDLLLPLVDPEANLAPVAMAVGPDGSFIFLSNRTLYKFRRDGTPAWVLARLDGSDQDQLPNAASLSVDWARGFIYLADITGRRIVKLLDRGVAREKGARIDFEEKLIALRAGISGGDAAALTAAADLYSAAGSTLMARVYWQRLDDADPGNATAADRIGAIDTEDIRAAGRELDARARAALSSIGVETARPLSMQAIQKYELVLSRAPGDEQTRKSMAALKDLFSEKPPAQEKRRPLTIVEVKMATLFPALMQWYSGHPAGTVTVKNPLTEKVENIRARLFIPRFMDLPADASPVASLGPGESVTFALSPAFNQGVLELQEDMLVQAQVEVTYGPGGADQTATNVSRVTVYRNSALTWDDTRKIASFITPNEATVAGFAARVLAAASARPKTGFSSTFYQAMRIIDAAGAYGIAYVPDPDSPVTRALGKSEIVDTVRFPRVTLSNRTGDCDDTAALLCSLLESAGVRTAVLTSPGHIFMAFNSGEPAENAQFLSGAGLEVIVREGAAWIPVETTVLSKGFMAAWAAASELVKKYAKTGPFEFLPVAGARDSYPSVPLPPSTLTIVDPAAATTSAAFSASVAGFTAAAYTSRVKDLEASLASLSGRQAVKARVQQGVLHALFGKTSEAEAAFKKAIADDPTLVSPYVNLANLRLMAGDAEGALLAVKQGLSKNAESALLNLVGARISADRGNTADAARYYAVVQKASPELAARFPELASKAGGTARAGNAASTPVVIWGSD